jgi:hypothetical protein
MSSYEVEVSIGTIRVTVEEADSEDEAIDRAADDLIADPDYLLDGATWSVRPLEATE